jgi:purine-binding chemotaxis protein CheW
MDQYLVYSLDEQSYAIHLSAVARVVRMVEVLPLPKSPPFVLGLIDLQGRIVPVISARRLLGLPERDLDLNDRLIILDTARQTIALMVDEVTGVIHPSAQEVSSGGEVVTKLDYADGVLQLEGGMTLIQNPARLLSSQEEEILRQAVQAVG